MSRPAKAAALASILMTGVLAGVLLDFWLFTAPALRTFPGVEWTQFTQALDRQYLRPAPVLYTLVNVSAVVAVAAWWRHRHRQRLPLLFALAALVLAAVATASTLAINVPINAEVLSWSPAAPPGNWEQVRDRWTLAHTIRTGLATAAFVLEAAALLAAVGRQQPRATQD